MFTYIYSTQVKNASGTQWWAVKAENLDQANKAIEEGKADLIAEEVEVTALEDPELDEVIVGDDPLPLDQLERNQSEELKYLRFFYANADFGPAHSDVVDSINADFLTDHEKLPAGYERE